MAEVGGMIASAVGKHVASKLGELVKDEIALLWGFEEEVEGMRGKMEDLVALMQDADDRMRRGEPDGKAVERWLAKFKSVAYDVEDVLDELDANELINKTQSKVKLFFSGNNRLLQRSKTHHNMKIVREKIDKIEKEGQTLNLVRHEARVEGSRNRETFAASSSEGMKTEMVGRDIEKEKIISLLLKSDATEDISVIPIIGLGGIGKSTLAESVLADQRVNVFDVQVWVHVSEKFDLHNIGCVIMKSINSSINLDNCTLQFLHDNLKKELTTTRYLIVLDDLWEEDGNRLEELKRMLQYGCKGSRIVVTTRNKSLVQTLSTRFLAKERKICPVTDSDQINLGVLSPNDCWEVMKQRVFGPGDDQSGLQEIGMEIAMKCGGIPLVANALGQVMFELRTLKAWEDIRDTKFDLGLRELHQNKTLECLMLSYYYMKAEYKMGFAYLDVFPKGFVVDSHRLIQQWMALGYIHVENDGERCIKYLLGMSFLQISRSSSNVRHPQDAERAKLRDKSNLQLLALGWEVNAEECKSVLERHVPPRTLDCFYLYGYMGKDFPSWMSQISSYLPCLTYLVVSGLATCETLPPFGRLPNLRSLRMKNIPNIRIIGKEFYGGGGACIKLRSIQLESMENLVEWWTTQSSEENEEFLIPNLHRLDIMNCPKLKFRPYPPRSMILHLENSAEVFPESGFGKLSSSALPFQMVIKNCNLSSDKWQALQHMPTLETFQVESCSGLRALPEVVRCFTSLTTLFLTSLKQLEALPEWKLHYTDELEELEINRTSAATATLSRPEHNYSMGFQAPCATRAAMLL
uniref:Uncharacterized protein n=1 Tax=Avena sativa TaxID=4498 RepID=A0ACD5XCU3_AVESA